MKEKDETEKVRQEESRIRLYLQQKELLETFLERGAISQAQFDKSFGDLTEKMGMREYAGKRETEIINGTKPGFEK